MSEVVTLARLEAIVDRSGVAGSIEALLPVGVRSRQLPVRSLVLGMLITQAEHRPAHLTRAHQALVGLEEVDRARLGVVTDWPTGPHLLTYRQVEYTFGLVEKTLAKGSPDGAPSDALAGIVDDLVEAGIPASYKQASTSLAVDWSDHETFSCPPAEKDGPCADPEASWGHRRGGAPGQKHELFFGYYLSAATMVNDEGAPAVPELARRIALSSAHLDPVPGFVPTIERLAKTGVVIGDVLADSGYAHRNATNWALPLRALGADIVTDLHPSDRGPKGTFAGAVISNGNLYCPATPAVLLDIGPLARGASEAGTAAHDRQTAEASRYKLGRISTDDTDGYHRAACPAVTGKIRCPLREASMSLPHERPEVLSPPEHPPTCCSQTTVTVGPQVAAKTAQKHDYPSKAWRRSYARRSAVERTFATLKDQASTDINRGWCRLMGLSAITLFVAAAFVVRNERIVAAFEARAAEDVRRATAGLEPKRRRRRTTLADLAAGSDSAPP